LKLGTKMADDLLKLVKASMQLTQFAVANLPPETTRSWPTKLLLEVADGIQCPHG
jgi:hypothetical protein